MQGDTKHINTKGLELGKCLALLEKMWEMQDKKLNALIESVFERFVIMDSPGNPLPLSVPLEDSLWTQGECCFSQHYWEKLNERTSSCPLEFCAVCFCGHQRSDLGKIKGKEAWTLTWIRCWLHFLKHSWKKAQDGGNHSLLLLVRNHFLAFLANLES